MIKKFNIGDRVIHEYLGEGVVTKLIKNYYQPKLTQFYVVLFDNTPDVKYNGGNNECLVLAYDIIGEE
jgi:hypothetical protein